VAKPHAFHADRWKWIEAFARRLAALSCVNPSLLPQRFYPVLKPVRYSRTTAEMMQPLGQARNGLF
jgi:hypothetical protein